MASLKIKREVARTIVKTYFKDDNENPFILTDSQCDIFNLVWLQESSRNVALTSTQYGKSTVIAMALIIASQTLKQDFVVVGGTKEKADIIMSKVIEHLFDNKALLSQLEHDPTEKLDRIRMRKSRENLTWRTGGSIRILTGDTKNRKRVKEALTGHGSKYVVVEEASLMPDDVNSMIMRMLGDVQGTFLLKIGNAVHNNHFKRSSDDTKYNKIIVDWKIAVNEGRYSLEYIDEMREEMTPELFRSFYDCIFPDRDEVDDGGYRYLFKDKLLSDLFIEDIELDTTMQLYYGCDVGEGNNKSVHVQRRGLTMKITNANQYKDTMQQVPIIQEANPDNGGIDATGIGSGLANRCAELNIQLSGVMWGSQANNSRMFANKKAENFWDFMKWIEDGGKIERNDELKLELQELRYKITSSGKVQMESKIDMKDRGIESPDEADACALTFNHKITPKIV